jgi:dipeptidyl aminopeptidase/acylaminoacyl peptidase
MRGGKSGAIQGRFHRAVRLLLALLPLASFPTHARPSDELGPPRGAERPVGIADSIEMTRFADGLYELGVSSQDLIGDWSPDRTRFTVVLRRGNIERNTNEYSLLLFTAADIINSRPRPKTLVTFASSSNLPAISHVKWLNRKTVAFLRGGSGGLQQLYTANCTTRRVARVISWPTNVVAYDATADLHQIVFIAEKAANKPSSEEVDRHGLVISPMPLSEVLGIGNFYGHQYQLFLRTEGGKPRRLGADKIISGYSYPADRWKLSISPDGKHALMEMRAITFPEVWKKYTNETVRMLTRANEDGPKTISTYMLIDLKAGSMESLLDTPNQDLSNYVWAPDGQSIVASNIFLPLAISDDGKRERRQASPFVAEVKLTREVVPITDKEIKVVRWRQKPSNLLFRSKDGTQVLYRKTSNRWQEIGYAPTEESAAEDLDISLEEGANTAPRIIATVPGTGQKILVLDLNPQFAKLRFAKVEVVRWKATDGHEVEGGLYLPTNYVLGTKYPLVIQTHGFDPGRFYIDGPSTTAFAAQGLAGSGIAVLQIGINKDKPILSRDPMEGAREMATFEGAVDYLDKRGLIDRNRVGLIGFSRTCYHVLYALTHSNYHFEAASVSDGVDGGYFQYVMGENLGSEITSWFEVANHGPPFGVNLLSWFRSSPGFNLDKVDTPLRIEALGLDSALSEWEWLAGLRRLGKPVDAILIRNASHNLQKPWDRLISQGGELDWFRFWLKDEEDPAFAKTEQYRRWRELQKVRRQTAHKGTPRPE